MRLRIGFHIGKAGLASLIVVGFLAALQAPPAQAQAVSPNLTIDQILYQPLRIAVAEDGRMYVSEPRRNRVRVLSATGQVQFNYLVDRPLAVGQDLQGLVLIGHDTRVDAFQESGEIAYSLGIGEGEFTKPNDLAVSPDGRIYVTDSPQSCVKVYDASGAFLTSFGSLGSAEGEFRFPTGIAVYPGQNEILVADQGNSRIQVFDLDGNFLREFGQFPYQQGGQYVFEGTFSRVQGLAIDALGRVYVVDSYQNHVQILTSSGEFLDFIAVDGGGEQHFSLPMDAAVSGNQLCITSTVNSQVQTFTLDDVTGVPGEDSTPVPEKFGLEQNYPNPFNPETTIRFSLPQSGWVELTVWDISGRLVTRLLDAPRLAGSHEASWNGRTLQGGVASSGLYFYNLKITNGSGATVFNQNRKMLLLK